jgi:ankyrin repeat protein/ketosteroid isomerase-like protein
VLFYVQMRWNYQGRISQDQLWNLETLEGEHGVAGIRSGFVQLYKVVSQHRIIAIVQADSLENLDRNSMGWLPMREYIEFEVVWALRDYEGFLEDVKARFPQHAAETAALPALAPAVSPPMTRAVVDRWFAAMGRGDTATALGCLDDNVVWINNPGEKGLSDIVPWLGEYHGRAAVAETFVIWGQNSQIKKFEVLKIVVEGDEALCIVHEVATIKATGLDYDIEFIQRIRVANDRIVSWKSYWDTSKGIVPFRGDMHRRLLAAAANGDHGEAMKVLPFGCDPNATDEASGQTALMIAAARGHVDLVRSLLEAGADPNIADRHAGAAALHKACQGGYLSCAQMLVDHGALIDQQATTTGHTPLVEAVWFKSDAVVRYLLDRNARLELKTYYGFTLDQHIEYAERVSKGQSDLEKLGTIKNLIAARRVRDDVAKNAAKLIGATLAKDLEAVRRELREGASVDQRFPIIGSFEDGHTPLLVAAREGQAEIVDELLKAGADVNAVEPVFGAVPLHKATYNGYADITRRLAGHAGVNLDFQGASNGYTPLHDALWHGFADCAEILVDAGARTDIVAYDGRRPLDLAIEKLGEAHPLVAKLRSTGAGKAGP